MQAEGFYFLPVGLSTRGLQHPQMHVLRTCLSHVRSRLPPQGWPLLFTVTKHSSLGALSYWAAAEGYHSFVQEP